MRAALDPRALLRRAAESDAARLEADLGPTVPSLAVRAAPALLVALLGLLAEQGLVALALAALLALVLTVRPALPAAAWTTLLVALWMMAGPDLLAPELGPGGAVRAALLVLTIHALVVASGLAAHVPWHGVVELSVLGRAARRALVLQVLVQALLWGTWWLRSTTEPIGSDLLRAIALLAALGVALMVLPRRPGGRPRLLRR